LFARIDPNTNPDYARVRELKAKKSALKHRRAQDCSGLKNTPVSCRLTNVCESCFQRVRRRPAERTTRSRRRRRLSQIPPSINFREAAFHSDSGALKTKDRKNAGLEVDGTDNEDIRGVQVGRRRAYCLNA